MAPLNPPVLAPDFVARPIVSAVRVPFDIFSHEVLVTEALLFSPTVRLPTNASRVPPSKSTVPCPERPPASAVTSPTVHSRTAAVPLAERRTRLGLESPDWNARAAVEFVDPTLKTSARIVLVVPRFTLAE